MTSSVDMLPFLVSLGHNGSRAWMTGHLAEIYGPRHDMVPMLRSASAPGRPYVLLATDELVPGFSTSTIAPLHVAGVRTQRRSWEPIRSGIRYRADRAGSTQTEFYDYSTPNGIQELTSTPDDPRAHDLQDLLFGQRLPPSSGLACLVVLLACRPSPAGNTFCLPSRFWLQTRALPQGTSCAPSATDANSDLERSADRRIASLWCRADRTCRRGIRC